MVDSALGIDGGARGGAAQRFARLGHTLRVLARVQGRYRLAVLGVSAIVGAAAGFTATAIARAIGLAGLDAPWIVVGLGAAVAAPAIAGLFLILRNVPNLASIARQCDRRFQLDDRVSTAMALLAQPPPVLNVVERALLRDAASAGVRIAPRDLVSLRPGSGVVALIGLLGLALMANVLLTAGPGDWLKVVQAGPQPGVGAASESNAPIAVELQTIADRVGADAKRADDAYLKAISGSLAELSANVSRGGLSGKALDTQFSALLAHLALAYGESRPEWLSELSAAGNNLDALAAAAGAGDAMGRAEVPKQSANANPNTGASPQSAPSSTSRAASLPPNLQAADPAVQGSDTDVRGLSVYQEGGEIDPTTQAERQLLAQQTVNQPAAGQAIGSSRNATKGGNQAGEGTAPDQGPPGDLPEVVAATKDLLLPGQPRAGGRTIKVDIPPEQKLTDAPAMAIGSAGWVRRPEGLVAAEQIPSDRRAIVGSYFDRPRN